MNEIRRLKLLQILVLVSMLCYLGPYWVTPDYTEPALEKAFDELSYEDSLIVSEFFDNYFGYIDPISDRIDNFSVVFGFIMIALIIETTRSTYRLDESIVTHETRRAPDE